MPFLSLAWAFLKSPLGRYLAIALVALAMILGLRSHWIGEGKAREVRAEAARLAVAEKRKAVRESKASAITEKVGQKLQAEHVRIEYRTVTLTREVPTYVTPAADRACVVPVGFVQLYNAAASPSGVPSSPGGSVEAPSNVPLSAVLETDVGNLGSGYELLAEVKAWRAWYAAQAAEWARR